MDIVVERLREANGDFYAHERKEIVLEAAAEIARLRAEVAQLRERKTPATRCVNCRWWNGDREYAAQSSFEADRHGKCHAVHSSNALPDDFPVRLRPVGNGSWLSTRFDFSCAIWEVMHNPPPARER